MKTLLFFFALILPLASLQAAEPDLHNLKVAPGYQVNVYAEAPGARSLTLGKDGTVFVGTQAEGKVYALLPDKNGDGKADGVKVVASGLNTPNGVAYKDGDLYIAEISRLKVIHGIDDKLGQENQAETWGPTFPPDRHHGWKFIAFGPDGWLYVPEGMPCNVCERNPQVYGTISKVSPDGKQKTVVATGIRNTVGFDWEGGSLWFTDNGRDNLGDNIPPDELNHLAKAGENFGFPYCHGGDIPDPEFGSRHSCSEFVPPVFKFPAHVAALGMRFLHKQKKWKGAILVAEHGSWNRSTPVGYQVVVLEPKGAHGFVSHPFLSGFLQGRNVTGRPVDVLELPHGDILVSDDYGGRVYRLSPKP
jgi:glucose/arabinose dehydrogenase